MAKLFLIITIILCVKGHAQNIINKSFETKIGSTCEEGVESIRMIDFYRKFNFKKRIVEVIEFELGTDSEYIEETKAYKWKLVNDIIIIKDYNVYKKIRLKENKVICLDHYNNEFKFEEVNKSMIRPR